MVIALAKVAAIAALAGAAAAGPAGCWLRDLQADAADLKRAEAAERQRIRNADRAEWAGTTFEDDRDAIRDQLRAAQNTLAAALATPVPQCPAVAVGDVVLPAAALDRLRAVAAGDQRTDPAGAGPGLRFRPADPRR